MSRDDHDQPARAGLPARLDPRVDRQGRQATGGARRLVWTGRVTAGLLSLALLVTSGWGWYLGQVAEATVNRTDAIPTAGNEQTVTTGAAMNLLLVGSDSRAALSDEQLAELNAGSDSGTNTDTMILVHVPADGSKASFVSFPRDSYVQVPGHGSAKLNAAYAYGRSDAPASATEEEKSAAGARLLVQTLSQLTGLRIDHYAEVDLLGFFELSNVVGGVEVNLCAPVDDRRWSGAFFPAGPQTISGADALKFVRQRHNIGKTSSDFDRIRRQQVFLAGVLRKMLSEDTLRDLGTQNELVRAVSEALTVDDDLDLMELAQQMQSVTAGSIEFQTVPNEGEARDEEAGSIIRLADAATLRAFFAELSADPAPAPTTEAAPAPTQAPAPTAAPGDVSVQVLNGSGTSGLAGKAASGLTRAGFQVAGTGNADSMGHDVTEVHFAAGDDALAAALAGSVPGAVLLQVDDATPGTVQLVLGSDFNGVGQAVTPPSAATEASVAEVEPPRTAADESCIN